MRMEVVRRKAVERALFISMRRTEHLGWCEGKCNVPGMAEIVCGKGRVRKKFMGRGTQGAGVGLTGEKQEV